jgi:tetratricopeptide (TPR) repeat protein
MRSESFEECLEVAREYRKNGDLQEALVNFQMAQMQDPIRPELSEYVETLVDLGEIDRAVFESFLLLFQQIFIGSVRNHRDLVMYSRLIEKMADRSLGDQRYDESRLETLVELMGYTDDLERFRNLENFATYGNLGTVAFDLFEVLNKVQDPFWLPHIGLLCLMYLTQEDPIHLGLEEVDSEGHEYPDEDNFPNSDEYWEKQEEWVDRFRARGTALMKAVQEKAEEAGFRYESGRMYKMRIMVGIFWGYIEAIQSGEINVMSENTDVADKSPRLNTALEFPEINLLFGEAAMLAGDLDVALEAFGLVPETHPFYLRTAVKTAEILWKRGEHQAALDTYQKAQIPGKPSEVLLSATLGHLQELVGQKSQASLKAFKNPYGEEEGEEFQRFVAQLIQNVGDRLIEEIKEKGPLQASDSQNIKDTISSGESDRLEFKETLSVDISTNQKSDPVLVSSLKTVVAFLNSKGGRLLIGVSDEAEVKGLGPDFLLCKTDKQNVDGLELRFREVLNTRLDPQPVGYSKVAFHRVDGLDVMEVVVDPKQGLTFVDVPDKKSGEKVKRLYVRDGNRTIELTGPDLVDWFQSRKI